MLSGFPVLVPKSIEELAGEVVPQEELLVAQLEAAVEQKVTWF
jgi:hypothetical protein